MTTMKKIIECVPNFSEGRDLKKIEKIVEPFRGKEGVKLLDYQNDEDHNRSVVTVVGEPEALKTAVIEAMGVAIELIDMNSHQGQHPRMGAVDVVPFIPVKNISVEEAVEISKSTAKEAATKHKLPIFLYEHSASRPRNSLNRSGNRILDRNRLIPRPGLRPWVPACLWWLIMLTWIPTNWKSLI
jgi:glutamate formiminotransferase